MVGITQKILRQYGFMGAVHILSVTSYWDVVLQVSVCRTVLNLYYYLAICQYLAVENK